MPLQYRKNPHCLNCNHPLQQEDNYCSQCGQENNDRRVSFKELVIEVLSNLFSFDSQFARSIIPFLFKPGFLTREFLAGKRRRYIHPLRLYFAVSFVFFLLVMPSFDSLNSNNKPKNKKANTTSSLDSLKTDTLKKDKAHNDIVNITKAAEGEPVFRITTDEDKNEKDDGEKDTLKSLKSHFDPTSKNEMEKWLKLLSGNNRKLIRKYKLNPEQLLDSIGLEPSWFKTILARQAIKLAEDEDGKAFGSYLISKVPLMMFFLMPMVALLLKILYFGAFSRTASLLRYGVSHGIYHTRRLIQPQIKPPAVTIYTPPRRFYIEHLIFTLHLHSFIFFVFVIGELISRFFSPGGVIAILSVAATIYTWLSFKRVYLEGWFKTSMKMFILFIGYSVCLSLCMIGMVIAGVLLF
jgi:hypothetical protein